MKIIQVFNRYLNPGGEENSVARIAGDMERGGHTVIRFWRSTAEWHSPGAPPKWRQLFLLWNNRQVLEELADLQRRDLAACWVVHNVVPLISLGIYPLAATLGVPIIHWLHNYRPLSPSGTLAAGCDALDPADPRLVWKEIRAGSWNGRLLTAWVALGYWNLKRRDGFRSVRAWVAVSEEMKRVFIRGGWPSEAVQVLRHSWNRQTTALSTADDGYFLFLGRLVESKGVRFLVDLWRAQALADSQLVIAGQGPLADELASAAPPTVKWVGYVQGEEKKQLLARCRAVLFPSTWPEPLSTVAYEAYELGKPILTSDRGGMKEIVLDGQTGAVLPLEPAAWIQAILKLSHDPALAKKLGAAGSAWLDRNVSPERWVQQFNQIAQTVLPSVPGRC